MKIPDEFMQTDIQYQQREEQNEEETKEIQRRGSVDITTAFKVSQHKTCFWTPQIVQSGSTRIFQAF